MKINITMIALLLTSLYAAPGRAAADASQPSSSAQQPEPSSPQPPSQGAPQPSGSEPKAGEAASKEEVKTLAEEIRRLKLELGLKDVELQGYGGMGPAASKVYYSQKGLSIGGYGEVNYVNDLAGASRDATDVLRAVVYLGYRFNPRIVLNSELEFEHAGKEVSVEFAYLDFLFTDAARLRVGKILMPVGITNELHEPPFFNGVFRPDVEQRIIPTTWAENGLALHGQVGGLRWEAAGVNGLDLLGNPGGEEDPVAADSWIRNGRTGGAEARAASFAGVAALEYALGPASVGGSFYGGRADQRRAPGVKATVTLTEAHARVAWRGISARALGVVGTLGDATAVNDALGFTGGPGLGARVQGGYVEAAYDVLTRLAPGGEASLSPFVRWERYDLNARAASGYVRDPALDLSVVTAGLTYKPIATVALKADWQRRDPREGTTSNQINVGAGFVF